MKQVFTITGRWSVAILLLLGTFLEASAQATTRDVRAENKVAILPMTYIGEGADAKQEQMGYSLQNIAHRYLQQDASELKFQDPGETNAVLLKNKITAASFREYTPQELASLLQVEYVLFGIVMQETEAILTVSQSNRSFSSREYHGRKFSTEKSGFSNSRTSQDINTTVDLSIYNDKGEKIFSRSRRSLLSAPDAYKAGLQYLLKRTPLYKR